jgi:L-ascorbate metabolism protein UlaG (beta-lactamase superfamily)
MAELHYIGHSTLILETGGVRIMFDPYLFENPATDLTVEGVEELDFILCTHGHFDHFMDAIPLAKATGATLVSTFEIASFASEQGVEHTHPLGAGGGHAFPFGYVKLTPAMHGGQVYGDDGRWSTAPGGFLITLAEGGKRFYNMGDSALIRDFELLKGEVDVALVPIGDNFTMGPKDAARAVRMFEPEVVIPYHYNTWPLIAQDPEEFRRLVGDAARVEVLAPGERYEF